ncbi:hypothetical protein M9H77_30904 [Catharanthus roseus]|uniref:Uncharacterized protein n=1 Tax=Catharanthus roseus TaxID=4058 RepID=A0ACC0A184_CATRO|nr:hypothetical protein M9H77_30904 [Catharanthus roseus]
MNPLMEYIIELQLCLPSSPALAGCITHLAPKETGDNSAPDIRRCEKSSCEKRKNHKKTTNVRGDHNYRGAKSNKFDDLLRERRSKKILETLQPTSGRPPLIMHEQNTSQKTRWPSRMESTSRFILLAALILKAYSLTSSFGRVRSVAKILLCKKVLHSHRAKGKDRCEYPSIHLWMPIQQDKPTHTFREGENKSFLKIGSFVKNYRLNMHFSIRCPLKVISTGRITRGLRTMVC